MEVVKFHDREYFLVQKCQNNQDYDYDRDSYEAHAPWVVRMTSDLDDNRTRGHD